MLIFPRRWGKSFLLKEKINEPSELCGHGRSVLWMFFTISSQEGFCQVFVPEELKANSGNWETWIANAKEYLKALALAFQLASIP